MKTKLLTLLLSFCFFAKAQITITSADMPLVNDTVRYSTSATDVSSMLNDTGANRTWNFSNLVPNFQDIDTFKTALSLNYFAFSSSSYGLHEPDINFTLVSATKVYTFYKNSTASYVADGRGLTASGIPATQTYTGKDVIYKFPLAYGNRDTSSYYTNSVSLVVANLVSRGKRINVVDGWGAITTPYGTFNCVRVKSIVQQTDTVKITTPLAFSLPIAHNKTEYKWIANGEKIPILEIDVTTGTGAATTIKYRDGSKPQIFNGQARFTANKTIFAVNSPTDTCKLTNSSLNKPNSVQWTITPNTFQYLGGTNATSKAVAKIYFTAAGTYTVKLHALYDAGTSDTTRINYIFVGQAPTANFSSSVIGNTYPVTIVNLYDSSTGTPAITAWKWTFVPNKVSFVGGTSSTSKNPKITFDSAANYAVTLKVTDPIGTNSITKNFSVFYTGINDVKQVHQEISVYPNPAENYFEMTIDKNEVDYFEVYGITGKSHQLNYKWKDQSICTVDCSQLSAGVYFVKFYFNDKTLIKKIIVR